MARFRRLDFLRELEALLQIEGGEGLPKVVRGSEIVLTIDLAKYIGGGDVPGECNCDTAAKQFYDAMFLEGDGETRGPLGGALIVDGVETWLRFGSINNIDGVDLTIEVPVTMSTLYARLMQTRIGGPTTLLTAGDVGYYRKTNALLVGDQSSPEWNDLNLSSYSAVLYDPQTSSDGDCFFRILPGTVGTSEMKQITVCNKSPYQQFIVRNPAETAVVDVNVYPLEPYQSLVMWLSTDGGGAAIWMATQAATQQSFPAPP